MESRITDVKIKWTPHEGQREILNCTDRFKFVACGRRWGKTVVAAMELITSVLRNAGSRTWWVAPTYDQADEGWRTIQEFLPADLIADSWRSNPRKLELVNGSTIGFRSAEYPDTLRGAGLDNLVIDEAAMVSREAWTDALRPTLSGTGGRMMAISTPNGRNWFREFFERGDLDEYSAFESFRYPTANSPYVPQSEIEDARRSLPERSFRREYLAEFIDDTGSVFTRVRERNVEAYDYESTDGEGPYTVGVDFGRLDDYTVIIVLDVAARLVAFERLQNATWPRIQDAVEAIYDRYPGQCYVDATRDNKIITDLQGEGVTIEPVRFTAQRKRALIENLAARLEAEEITLPDIAPLLTELEAYEATRTEAGTVQYGASGTFHDDCVDALALAAHRDAEATADRRMSETLSKLGPVLATVKS